MTCTQQFFFVLYHFRTSYFFANKSEIFLYEMAIDLVVFCLFVYSFLVRSPTLENWQIMIGAKIAEFDKSFFRISVLKKIISKRSAGAREYFLFLYYLIFFVIFCFLIWCEINKKRWYNMISAALGKRWFSTLDAKCK